MDQDFYTPHGALSDPGDCAAAFDGLPGDVARLSEVVQGVLLHDYYGGELYGSVPAEFAAYSRQTLPIAERLAAIHARDAAPLDQARRPFDRSVGTCRDFALMLCAMLRHRGTPARVRCGFASYFGGPGWEDHWVCEHWLAAEGRWALADPQLDDAHRRHLAIGFDTSDMPRDRFLLAWQAWRACRDGADPSQFGHGDDTGLWFVEVNLARDLLALTKRETSAWDAWRNAPMGGTHVLDEGRLARGDRMAALAETAVGLTAPSRRDVEAVCPAPPWEGGA
jgi:hypothetical protein